MYWKNKKIIYIIHFLGCKIKKEKLISNNDVWKNKKIKIF